VPKISAVNDAAVTAYRLTVPTGNPVSERRLAQMFGRTSRRWARARIADARQATPLKTRRHPGHGLIAGPVCIFAAVDGRAWLMLAWR